MSVLYIMTLKDVTNMLSRNFGKSAHCWSDISQEKAQPFLRLIKQQEIKSISRYVRIFFRPITLEKN